MLSFVLVVTLWYTSTFTPSSANIDCILKESLDMSGTGDGDTTSVICPPTHPTMTSCGCRTHQPSENATDGCWSDANVNTCYAQNGAWPANVNGEGVYAIARCCKFPAEDVDCKAISGTNYIQGDQSVTCDTATSYKYLTGCSAKSEGSTIDGSYPDQDDPFTIAPLHGVYYAMDGYCTAKNGDSGGGTRVEAICCDSPNYSLNCVLRYSQNVESAGSYTSVWCVDGYTMVGCSGFSEHRTLNAWYIDGNGICKARGYTVNPVVAIGICCKQTTDSPTAVTINPTLAPTEVPTVGTSNPTYTPTPIDGTIDPTLGPTLNPTSPPSGQPTGTPSKAPTNNPSGQPTGTPTSNPSKQPTKTPTTTPSKPPSKPPTEQPTNNPSGRPTSTPVISPGVTQSGAGTVIHNNNASTTDWTPVWVAIGLILGFICCCICVAAIFGYLWYKQKKGVDDVNNPNYAARVSAVSVSPEVGRSIDEEDDHKIARDIAMEEGGATTAKLEGNGTAKATAIGDPGVMTPMKPKIEDAILDDERKDDMSLPDDSNDDDDENGGNGIVYQM